MLTYQGGRLFFEGRDVAELAGELGSPFFLVSEKRLTANYRALTRGFSHPSLTLRLRYCAKTNNERAILSLLAENGSHVLVSHPAELSLALTAGFVPERVAYQRPVLRLDECRQALRAGVEFFHAYHFSDLHKLEQAAGESSRRIKVSLRVRSDFLPPSPFRFLSRRLGWKEADILAAAAQVRDSRWLTLAALNAYEGTQSEGSGKFSALFRKLFRLMSRIEKSSGIVLEEINMGGGIPSPSLHKTSLLRRFYPWEGSFGDPPGLLEELATSLSRLYRREAERAGLNRCPVLAAEPGRAVAGNAAILVTRVLAQDGRWVFLDGSRNYLGESPLLFTRPVLPAVLPAPLRQHYYHLSGDTLNTLDVLDVWRKLPLLETGDYLVFGDAGAYSVSRACRYAGLPPAVCLLQGDGSLRVIRRPETVNDLAGPMMG